MNFDLNKACVHDDCKRFFYMKVLDRRAECAAAGRRPAIAIGNDFSIYVGNTTDTEISLTAGELFGFGRGTFEQKVVSLILGLSLIICF